MQLHKIRGGDKESLEAKLYNIGVGISLGNKWFTAANIVELINWSLKHTKEYVVVYVADSIHAINEEVRGRMSKERAMSRSLKKGEQIISAVKDMVDKEFSEEDRKRIVYVSWNEIVDEEYQKKMSYLIELFYSSSDFKDRIKSIVVKNTSKEDRIFDDTDIEKLSMYIVSELPEIICRVPMNQYSCDAYVYPFDGELTQLAEEIQLGHVFPQIKENIIDTEPKVFLEVR